MHYDLLQSRKVAESDVALQQREDGPTSWFPQGSVLVVRGGAIPAAQASAAGAGELAWGVVLVVEGLEVGGYGGGVGLGEAREGEGARYELAGDGVGGWWGLVRVKGPAVVFWGTELVAGKGWKVSLGYGAQKNGGGWGFRNIGQKGEGRRGRNTG